jgi:hypothetical protein
LQLLLVEQAPLSINNIQNSTVLIGFKDAMSIRDKIKKMFEKKQKEKKMNVYKISDKDVWEQVKSNMGEIEGTYKLHCLEEKEDAFVTIDHGQNKDVEGILYIGYARNVTVPVANLRKAICAVEGVDDYVDKNAHRCGPRYDDTAIRRQYPYKKLCVTIHPTTDAQACRDKLLRAYRSKFGICPLFNVGGVCQ